MAARLAKGDPRPQSRSVILLSGCIARKSLIAVDNLVRNRFLICDDTQDIVTRLLQAGLGAGVPPPNEKTEKAFNA